MCCFWQLRLSLPEAALADAERVWKRNVTAGFRAAKQSYWACGQCCHQEAER
jgi:hypothetical protein